VSPAHDGIEFIIRHSNHQITSNDAAAHPTAVQEGETAEHLAFDDVVPGAKRLANAIRELLVVRHGILPLTVRHLLAVMARVEFHEAHVVLHGHGAEDGRSHPLAVRGGLPAGLGELLVRRLELAPNEEAPISIGSPDRLPIRGCMRVVTWRSMR
jgi:hypothetical protein